MRKQTSKAFSIVEMLVVISIVAIFSTLAVITFTSVRQDSRDATRKTNASIISEALERYYEKNGEYPSVPSIVKEQVSNTGSAVASKLSIPATSLVNPNTPPMQTNALTSNAEPEEDLIAYVSADTNPECQSVTSGGCDQFTLKFHEEATGEIEVIESRRSSRETTFRPELDLNVTGLTSIGVSWTGVADATSYELQRSLSSDFSSSVTTTHAGTSSNATGLTVDTQYFFRVRGVLYETFSGWSDTQSATTSSLAAPTGTISIAAAMSGTNARGTASGGTCPASSTIEYQIRYQQNTAAWGSYTIGTPRDVAATEGYRYTFQAQARCKIGASFGPWASSLTAAVTRSVTAPASLTITATMSGTNARGTAAGGTCASGTTIERQIRYLVNAGAYVAYSTASYRDVAATSGYQYTFQQQARCVGTLSSSGWVASAAASVVRPVTAPASLTISAAIVSTSYARGTAGGGSCPAGTSIERQIRYAGSNTTAVGTYVAYATASYRDVAANQGYNYTFQQQARCIGAYASSGWVASGTANVVRPITAQPVNGTASVSTVGSLSTFSYNNATGCPVGTTYVYTYRYIAAVGPTYPPSWDANSPYYNNPPHNWSSQLPASTSYRTFVWNTSATYRNYYVHFAAMCATAHHTGPWPNSKLSDATNYYRP